MLPLLIAGLLTGNSAASAKPDCGDIAQPGTAKVGNAARLVPPSQVKPGGLIGERFLANEQNRLLRVDEDELLGGFQHRPGKQAWIGEHLGKWMHAAALSYGCTGDKALRTKLDRVASELIKTQEADGYLGTYLPEDRFCYTQDHEWDVWVHKYNLIGLLTYYQYTGSKEALKACKRIGDLLINTFGPGKKSIIATSHFNGMASTSILDPVMTLYSTTGDSRYLAFGEYVVSSWDEKGGPRILSGLLDHQPVYTYGDGKAYEFMSNVIGLIKLYRATGKKPYLKAALNAWKDIAEKRLYITGSGSNWERWRQDHFFPNANIVNGEEFMLCETCVTVTWMQLNVELLRTLGGSEFAEQIEKTIYNHLLGAQKPDGSAICVYPPLEGTKTYINSTNCCVSSGPRGIALTPAFLYTVTDDGIDVNVFSASKATVDLVGGGRVKLEQISEYPLDGKVVIKVDPEGVADAFAIRLRVPAWSPKVTADVNGDACELSVGAGFATIKREWKAGDTIAYAIDMAPRIILGDYGNTGKMAVMYGPLVLAADASHNPRAHAAPTEIGPAVDDTAEFKLHLTDKGKSDGVPRFETDGIAYTKGATQPSCFMLSLVPYYAVGADGSEFVVWIKRPPAAAEDR